MKITFWFAFLIILSVICCKADAIEVLRFERISDRDGLSQNTVRCIMQDSKGFMWLGTINGLNRYNGREFTVMLSQTGNSTLLCDNRIRSLQEDMHGYIWVRTMANTYSCYDTRMERFVDYNPGNKQKSYSNVSVFSNGDVWLWGKSGGCCRIQHISNGLQSRQFGDPELGSQRVYFVHEDRFHQIWIGAETGLFRLGNDKFEKISQEFFAFVHEFGNRMYFISEEHLVPFDLTQQKMLPATEFPINKALLNVTTLLDPGVILIATRKEIISFDCRKGKFVPTEAFFDGQNVRNATFYTDNKGHKWVYNLTGAVWRQVSDDRFEKINLIPPQIVSTIDAERYEIYHDSRDIIWITTYGNGLFSLDLNNGKTRHYTVDNSDLSANHLLCVMEDKSGEIWIGMEFAGIGKISLSNYPVQILEPAPNDSYNRNNVVRLLYEDSQQRFWLGTRNGFLHTYDASLKKTGTQKIEGGLPFSMVEDSSGNLWLGTRGNGVFLFPPSGKAPLRNFRMEENPQYSGSNNVFDIMLDTKSRLWVASLGGGLHCADIAGKDVKFRPIDLPSVNQTQRMLRVIVQDNTGMIWVGGNDGVLVFDPDELLRDNSKFINFSFDINDNKSLNNNQVKAIYEDSKGRLWFGTTGGGLNLLMREEPVERSWFKHYTAKNGLSNELIQAIIEDDEGYIWVSTEGGSGISRFNPQTERFENFSFSNDKQTELFDEDACWKMDDGRLMFGSYSGVFIFDPSKMKYDSYTPPIVITDLKINGTDVLPGENNSPLKESITLSSEIRLNYNQNSFNIAFAMLNFHLPNFNQYTYYLEGYEKSWNPVTRYNVAAYRNVKPGTYYFKVKGCNSFGVWTDTETTLKIVITPPFWKSLWAYLLYLILLGIAVFFSVRIIMQINRLHTAVEVERRLTDYKLRFFTNISHEFRTPLTIIRGSIENLTAIENLPPAVTKQINVMAKGSSRLLRLIEQLLTFRKLQNQKMELKLERIESVAFFYDIFQTFEDLAKKKNIEFLFRSNLPQREMLLDRSIWDKIAYNLLSNAMKHTPDNGKIVMRLDFYEQEDKMALSVEDNGHGVPKEKQGSLFERFAQLDSTAGGTGVGLHLTAELANLHKGKAGYNPSQLGGACFSVSIPLSEENYTKEEIIEASPSAGFANLASDALPETLPENKRYKDYKLLIIEDDDEVREFVFSQLEDSFSVFQAKDGEEGLEKAIHEQPNIIVCDVMMPGIDGFEVTRRLKEDFLTSHIPIILLTAHSSEEHQLEGIQAGADSYIIKPFSIIYLKPRITKLIEQREKLQQKFAQSPGLPAFPINLADRDKQFLDKIHALVEKNIGNVDFSVDAFAKTIGMGRTNFFKKVKGITGHSPNEYLNIIRMKKAAELLSTTDLNVSEVSYKVGINDPFYFSKCFKAQFGKPPSQFQKGN